MIPYSCMAQVQHPLNVVHNSTPFVKDKQLANTHMDMGAPYKQMISEMSICHLKI